jgi:hypothetical protein
MPTRWVAWVAALLLFVAALSAYLAIRNDHARPWQTWLADACFLGGLVALGIAVLVAAVYL